MKLFLSLFASCLLVGSTISAQTSTKSRRENSKIRDKNYCVMIQDKQRLVVKIEGKEILDNVMLGNGAILQTDGTVIRKDKSLLILNVGECVDTSGNLVSIRDMKIIMEAYDMPYTK